MATGRKWHKKNIAGIEIWELEISDIRYSVTHVPNGEYEVIRQPRRIDEKILIKDVTYHMEGRERVLSHWEKCHNHHKRGCGWIDKELISTFHDYDPRNATGKFKSLQDAKKAIATDFKELKSKRPQYVSYRVKRKTV